MVLAKNEKKKKTINLGATNEEMYGKAEPMSSKKKQYPDLRLYGVDYSCFDDDDAGKTMEAKIKYTVESVQTKSTKSRKVKDVVLKVESITL